MPHQQNPDRGSADAVPGAGRPPRNPGHDTATPDAPQLPRQRREMPARPPLNATPPGGRPANPPRPGPPAGRPQGRPGPVGPVNQHRPTRSMPGPGTPEVPVTGAVAPGGGSPGSVLPRPARNTSVMPGNMPGPLGGGPNGPVGPRDGSGQGGASGDGKDEKPASELSVNKVVAGAGAAIVTAILGSFLGAVGTILGAALGSIITTVATTFFQRSIDVTRTKVVGTTQRIKERKGGPGGTAVWQAAAQDGGTGLAGPDGQETVLLDPSATSTRPPGKGRHWTRVRMTRKQVIWSVVGAAMAFALAMFLVTGIEWIKGGTITGGGTGTSIGNVVSGSAPQTTENTDTGSSDSTSTSEPSTSTSEQDSSSSSTATSDPSSTSENGQDGSSSSSSNPLQDGLNRVLPSQQPESGQQQSGQSGSGGNSGGGAASSN